MRTWRSVLRSTVVGIVVWSIAPCVARGDAATEEKPQPKMVVDMLVQRGLTTLDQGCAAQQEAARDTGNTVAVRAAAAREYVRCLELLSALAISERAASPDSAKPRTPGDQVRALLADDQTRVAILNDGRQMATELAAKDEFLGLRWGLGFGWSLGFEDAIEDAELVDQKIRVTDDQTDQPRALFEFHQFMWCNDGGKNGDRGCGPFFAVAATSDNVLSGVGAGFAFGWRSKIPTSNDGFTVGGGAILDANVKSLADGFEPDDPLPPGETTIRFEEKSRWSYLIYFTRSF
jgi:hypothetical protein